MFTCLRNWRPTSTQAFVVALAALVLAATGGVPGLIARGSPSTGAGAAIGPARLVERNTMTLAKGQIVTVDVDCPNGYRVESGGFDVNGTINLNAMPSILENYGYGDKWRVRAANPSILAKDVEVMTIATCVKR